MSLINCPECNQKISDKASVCIHCGYPLSHEEYPPNSNTTIDPTPKNNSNFDTAQLIEDDKIEGKVLKADAFDDIDTFIPKRKNKNPKSKKRKIILIAIILLIGIPLFIYNTFIVRTVSSGNGWKHQVGHFGMCQFDSEEHCGEATHRYFFKGSPPELVQLFCDKHWESDGEPVYNGLTREVYLPSSTDILNAKICAEQAVKDTLKAPSTAEFCSHSDMEAEHLGNNQWIVSGYVDAQNSFGAFIRKDWSVTLTLTSSGFTDYSVEFYD